MAGNGGAGILSIFDKPSMTKCSLSTPGNLEYTAREELERLKRTKRERAQVDVKQQEKNRVAQAIHQMKAHLCADTWVMEKEI